MIVDIAREDRAVPRGAARSSATRVRRLVLKRTIASLVVLVAVSFGVFSLLTLAPGSEEQLLIGTQPATPQYRAALRHEYHLDDPFWVQYAYWLKGAARLHLGNSNQSGRPVSTVMREAAGTTLLLGGLAFVVAMVLGIGLGCLAGLRYGSSGDRAILGFSVFGLGVPVFASGTVLLYVFAVRLGWFPAFGAGHGRRDELRHLALPALALAISVSALVIRLSRAALIDTVRKDFIVFARARGLHPFKIFTRYILRNALIPIITAGGIVAIYVLTGAVLVETTFALPGLGGLLVQAIQVKDVPVVQGVVLAFSAVILAVNIAVDVGYVIADPRIHLGSGQPN